MNVPLIKSRRLTIAPPNALVYSFEDILTIYRDPDFHRYLINPKSPPSYEKVARIIAKNKKLCEEQDGEGIMLIRRDDSKGRIVGVIGVQESHREPREIVCGIHPEHRRAGFAREAVCAVLAHEFANGRERVIARADIGNQPSRKLIESFGFTRRTVHLRVGH